MKFVRNLLLMLALVVGAAPAPALAGDKDPLFISLSSDSGPRVSHVLHFADLHHSRGHPTTIFLNETGIHLASSRHAAKNAEHQLVLAELMSKGVNVLVCRFCMKQLNLDASELLPGFKVGNPDLVGGALFKDGTRTLSW
ncbi:MAG TPA: DsrE family protein [Quisquiliibacterium sp.]|nr:DsrE family protein [Quisquiliibacterium sp.]